MYMIVYIFGKLPHFQVLAQFAVIALLCLSTHRETEAFPYLCLFRIMGCDAAG